MHRPVNIPCKPSVSSDWPELVMDDVTEVSRLSGPIQLPKIIRPTYYSSLPERTIFDTCTESGEGKRERLPSIYVERLSPYLDVELQKLNSVTSLHKQELTGSRMSNTDLHDILSYDILETLHQTLDLPSHIWKFVAKMAGSAKTSNDVSQIENLQQLYLVKNEKELHRFLRGRVGLSEVLIESYEKIRGYFGDDARISLDVIADAEYQNDKQLFIFISPNCSFDEAIKTEERFINDWWLDVYERSSGHLNILLEFK